MTLPHCLDRTVVIQAAPTTVFKFLTENEHWASWWGPGSTIEPWPGGRLYVRHPNGIESAGEVLEVTPPSRMVFSYGFTSGTPIPVGASRVTITLAPQGRGTRLDLKHEFADAQVRDEHVQGWRYQLSLFANVVANLANAGAQSLVDEWFAAWAEPDAQARAATLSRVATADVLFRDRWGLLTGQADLVAHIGAALRFAPMRLERNGEVRHCQGTLLVNWVARSADGHTRGSGTNVFALDGGQIASVVGFWDAG
jgi:uncharacterized protein YndB with AHSA1/START domain